MYFKQVEMVGFKSFPSKTRLKFEPGVTAIVGPNGCGKSNIADAILWVLGEQSPRTLRGFSMEDVIFSGTDAAEPINMAEVSLTLSNENKVLPIDYNEVTITRRLFRSGESEYILNRTSVRLRDITNLLMGTGIGTSAYSIIGQGKIDLILSSKPEERRYIFEEASGITRYKSKKEEALRKLEHTENNLIRINDIINEVKRQISSIERHAKKAEKYKKDFEIMKDLDIRLTVDELRNINNALDENKKELDGIRNKENMLKLELNGIINLINKYRENLDDTIYNLTETQKNLSDATLFIDKSKHKIELNRERVQDLRNIKDGTIKEITNFQEKIKQEEEEIKTIKERLDSILKTKKDKENLLVQKEQAIREFSHQLDEHQNDIKGAKNRTIDLLAFQTKMKNELIKLGVDLQNRRSRLRRLETEKANTLEEKKSGESALNEAQKELNACRREIQSKASLVGGLKDSINSCEEALEDIRNRIIENEGTLNSLSSKEEILKEMIENFEGFDKDVKFIIEGVKNGALTGIIGLIADMLEPENGYERALEAVLDKKAQAIIVENKDIVTNIFSYLGNKTRANFIIYEDIKNSIFNKRHKTIMEKEKILPLSSFVRINSGHNILVDYLFADIYVVLNIEKAFEVLNRYNVNTKLVTKDGFIVEKGYISGGSKKDDTVTSIIGRRKKLIEVIEQKSYLQGDIEAFKKDKTLKEGAVIELKQKIAAANNDLKKEEIKLANAMSKNESIELNLKKINDEASIIKLEIDEVGELIHEVSLKGEDLNKHLNENETEYQKLEELISSSQEAIQIKTKAKNNMIFGVSEIKSEIAFLKNTEEQETKNLDREKNLLGELKAQYEIKERLVKDTEEKITTLDAEEKELQEGIDIESKKELSLREKLSEISENKKTLSQDLHDKEKICREKEKNIEDLRNQIRNLEIKNREGELGAENIKNRIREAYKMNIEDLPDVKMEEKTDWEAVRNQIEVLKIKLEKLGPVNLVAIEEHKELEERYLFLTQQQEDLIRAKESLHKAIVKINKTTKRLFIETFQKIQIEFKDYFRMLFGGGHAELLILDESDVLESGIEIVARPPGKKLQNLLLLSGGEKSLTAIALLFAIFKVKPSPFCILDEVDAALDESNISRFTQILQEFLKFSQFIVITHNKKTMQMANVLYGITMEDKGISKIVSVKFTDDEDKPAPKKEEVLI